jgi:hypothetical protein
MIHRKSGILLVPALAMLALPAYGDPRPVRGAQFITMMQSNTLSGETAAGTGFNIYFLPGGIANYVDETGKRDSGTWHLDKEGDVCVAWRDPAEQREGCFRVTVDGDKVAWEGKEGGGRGVLRGGITQTFLKSGVQ